MCRKKENLEGKERSEWVLYIRKMATWGGFGQKQNLTPQVGPCFLKAPVMVRSRVQMLRLSANNSSDSGEWETAGIPFHF